MKYDICKAHPKPGNAAHKQPELQGFGRASHVGGKPKIKPCRSSVLKGNPATL
jgi:hypothetical protein